jgi:hypothetical protein
MTDEAMSPLRRRMIEDMTIRKLAKGIETRISAEVGIVAIDLECLHALRVCGGGPRSSRFYPRFRRDLEVSRNGKPLEPRKARYLIRGFDDHCRSCLFARLGSAGVTKHQMKAVHRTARESNYPNIDGSKVHHLNSRVRLVPCSNGPEQPGHFRKSAGEVEGSALPP